MNRHASVEDSPVRRAREAAGMSREELAFRAGVSLKTIERLEANDRDHTPRRATMAMIALALGVEVDSLAEPTTEAA